MNHRREMGIKFQEKGRICVSNIPKPDHFDHGEELGIIFDEKPTFETMSGNKVDIAFTLHLVRNKIFEIGRSAIIDKYSTEAFTRKVLSNNADNSEMRIIATAGSIKPLVANVDDVGRILIPAGYRDKINQISGLRKGQLPRLEVQSIPNIRINESGKIPGVVLIPLTDHLNNIINISRLSFTIGEILKMGLEVNSDDKTQTAPYENQPTSSVVQHSTVQSNHQINYNS